MVADRGKPWRRSPSWSSGSASSPTSLGIALISEHLLPRSSSAGPQNVAYIGRYGCTRRALIPHLGINARGPAVRGPSGRSVRVDRRYGSSELGAGTASTVTARSGSLSAAVTSAGWATIVLLAAWPSALSSSDRS